MKKPQNTEYFHYVNVNPYKRKTTDCVVRAITIALYSHCIDNDMDWEKLMRDGWIVILQSLTEHTIKTGYMYDDKDGFASFLETYHGFKKQKQPRHADGTKYTVREFIDEHPKGTYLLNMPSHLTVVVDGKAYDTWNVTKSQRRVGNYWTRD